MYRLLIAILMVLLMGPASFVRQQSLNLPDPEAVSGTEITAGDLEEEAAEAEAGIESINKYGNITLTIEPAALEELGFEIGDMILVRIGDGQAVMPIGTAYSDVDSGKSVCVFKTDSEDGSSKVVLAINSGSLASALGIARISSIEAEPGYEVTFLEGFDQETAVYLSLVEKQGYAEEYKMHQIVGTRSNNREDYPGLSDAEYANFREVTTTGMGKGTLFRSSSPIDPSLNRNREADAMILDSGIQVIVNMADSEDTLTAYPEYDGTNYSQCSIIPLNMGMDFKSEDFTKKLAEGFRYMASHEGPYLIHCVEGKDRTGFAAGVLECLMGAGADEIVEDYMLTYTNYYGVDPGSEQYLQIADSNIKTTLADSFGIGAIDDENVSLGQCASDYLIKIGMTQEEISSLKVSLGRSSR